jgi:transcriptional regulator with XRE-family HTH domain
MAARLRLAREQAGLSQGQVAKLMGMHRPTISEIEAGRRRVQAKELAEFARHYRVSVRWLLGQEDEGDDVHAAKIRLAARQLARLKNDDLDLVMNLLASLRDDDAAGGHKP